ncbi:MAG: ribonuclease III [Tissierellia bacterium]|nr:ribonuclease III [Tissierellia bacterium]
MNISPERKKKLEELQAIINYKFKDLNLLNTSLTHSSYANENKQAGVVSNERLEFLGDVVIDLVVSEYLYKRLTELPEGELSKRRASVVCESSLAFAAHKIKLGKFLLLGKGEEATGGRERESILADAFEALTGAIYIDGKYESARDFLLGNFEQEVIYALSKGSLFKDYKTELQEKLQRKTKSKIEYVVVKEDGPDHRKKFYMNVIVENKVIGKGMGRNKKEAEQNAAKQALMNLGEHFE